MDPGFRRDDDRGRYFAVRMDRVLNKWGGAPCEIRSAITEVRATQVRIAAF